MFNNMKEQFVQIFWSLAILSTLFKNASGSGKVTVLLVDYGNSKSRLVDGSCCDNLGWCISSCDNFFRLCFASTSSSDKCALWKGWTAVLGGDSFSFSKGSLGNGITNPVTYSFTRWQTLVFDVEVWDNDDGHIIGKAKDFVDHYSLSIRTSPSANLAAARARRYKLTGPGYSYLNVEVKVFCDANYFIPDCSTYCVPRDDNSGHYICDFIQGRRVCLSGWFGSDCLTYCVARNDTLGHYSCDANGQKQCSSNWYGQDCLVYCKAMDNTLGHYSCDANGQRQCLNNWYGQDCLIYCEPRNDTQGHYMCDSTGNIDCLPGWKGNNCTEENVTSVSTAISFTPAFSSPLASAARTNAVPTPLMPSSVYLLLSTSIYSVGKSTSLPCKGTVKIFFSSNKVGSTGMTSSAFGLSVTRNNIPHMSALMTTSSEHSVNMNSAPVRTTTWAAVCESVATESSLVSLNSLQMLASRLATSNELIDLERTETTRVSISLKFHYTPEFKSLHQTSLFSKITRSNPGAEISKMTNSSTRLRRTLGLIIPTSMSQQSSSPTVTGEQVSAPTDQLTETDKVTFSSLRLYRTSGRQTQTSLTQPSSPLKTSTSQPDVPTLASTSTIVLRHGTTHEVTMTKPTETKEKMIPSTVLAYQRQTFLSVSSLQAMASTVMLASSVALRCAPNEEGTALPTSQPKETSNIPGIMVQFQPVKSDQELGLPWMVRKIKSVLAEQLNSVCRETPKACDLLEEEMFSVWFCPAEVNIEIHDVREQGMSFKVTAVLPPPLNGMVPLQTMLEVLKMSKKDLESKTQANITWIPVYGSTTPRSNYMGPGQLPRFSSRESTSPLPYIFGIAGAGLILLVVLLVVRAKRNKNRSRVYPCVEDEMLPSPADECRSDAIVLLSQTKGKYTCKRDKEEFSNNNNNNNRDNDAVHLPGAIEENHL